MFALLFAALLATAVAQGGYITCDTPWIVDETELTSPANLSFQLALKDIKHDWYSRLGCRPLVVTTVDGLNTSSTMSNVTSVVFGTAQSTSMQPHLADVPSNCLHGWENHCLFAVKDNAFGGVAIVAYGSDTRGAIFAAYSLSDVVLDVQPFDYWLHIEPETVQTLQVTKNLPHLPGSPTFKYRAFFVNDEDLFGGLHNDPLGQSVWSMDILDKLYSTTLRLKANAVLPGTNIFPDNPAYALANRRGLALSSHHYNILGLSPVAQSVATWFPEDYNYQSRPDAMLWAWNASAHAWAKFDEVFWTIGYRGAGDEPAKCLGRCTTADKADHVSWAIHNQTELVKKIQPDAEFYTWLWDEGLSYLESGHLKIPMNTTVVFTDDGNGEVRGLEYATSGAGIYTHVAMLDGRANQLTEMVPISRIFSSIANFVQKKATSIFVLNVSDLLPYIMGTLANFQAIYDSTNFMCNQTIHAQCDALQLKWIAQWSQQTFRVSQRDAQIIAEAYADYYNVSYIFDGNADDFLAGLITTAAQFVDRPRSRVSSVSGADSVSNKTHWLHSDSYNWTQASETLCNALDRVQNVAQRVPAGRQQALAATVVNSLSYHCHATSGLVLVQAAAQAHHNNDNTSAFAAMQQALGHMDQIAQSLAQAEGVRFRGLFANDQLTCQPRARRAILATMAQLKPTPQSLALAVANSHDVWSCQGYRDMYHYQYAFAQQRYPTEFANSTTNMFDWPQAYCSYSDNTHSNSSWCIPNPSGAVFKGDSVVVHLKAASGAPVRYTTDGSEPDRSSPLGNQVVLTRTTRVKVQLASALESSGPTSQPSTTMDFIQV
eukprot:TRINITY_DN11643_c0_g1_i2.p1 TRINITY_DN11643_c0_g1~~TRINITY_DN11643_c0_g1_i2.p1  ORF type:complete len:828 (+),score=185.36 TRINITY_DN11643_c0_g1_i2:198-2681(+)